MWVLFFGWFSEVRCFAQRSSCSCFLLNILLWNDSSFKEETFKAILESVCCFFVGICYTTQVRAAHLYCKGSTWWIHLFLFLSLHLRRCNELGWKKQKTPRCIIPFLFYCHLHSELQSRKPKMRALMCFFPVWDNSQITTDCIKTC